MVKSITLFTLLFLFLSSSCFGAYRYVDGGTIEASATWSGVDGESYTDSGPEFPGAGYGYGTIQNAVDAMSVGDTIYIRGGTYQPTAEGANSAAVYIPTSLNGSSWDEGYFNTMASYPGEWAIIDGQYNAGPYGILVGAGDNWSGCGGTHAYWKFERLEFYRGTIRSDTSGGAGLQLRGGPFIIRYCYFNDNFDDANDNNPGGLAFHILHDSIIEYNYFYHNGYNGGNGANIIIYPDYKEESGGYDDLDDISCADRNNEIRYNYFIASNGSTASGHHIKYKGHQMLGPRLSPYGTTYQEYGVKIHHNIFADAASDASVVIRGDFQQLYNNVFVGSSLAIMFAEHNTFNALKSVAYNNSIIGGYARIDNKTDCGACPASFSTYLYGTAQPFDYSSYFINNLFDNFAVAGTYVFVIGAELPDTDAYRNDLVFNGNYIYRPSVNASTPFSIGNPIAARGNEYGHLSSANVETEYGGNTYQKTSSEGSDNLMTGASGADQYITRGTHVVESGSPDVTIADGGIGGNHPYLSGVTLPSYIGATNPSDNDWVAGVLALDATYFTNATAGSTPSWIEASGEGGGSGSMAMSGSGSMSMSGSGSASF